MVSVFKPPYLCSTLPCHLTHKSQPPPQCPHRMLALIKIYSKDQLVILFFCVGCKTRAGLFQVNSDTANVRWAVNNLKLGNTARFLSVILHPFCTPFCTPFFAKFLVTVTNRKNGICQSARGCDIIIVCDHLLFLHSIHEIDFAWSNGTAAVYWKQTEVRGKTAIPEAKDDI